MILTERQFQKRIEGYKVLLQTLQNQNQVLEKTLETLIASSEKLQQSAILIGIERVERRVIFTFSISGKLETIETIGTWADNVDKWKAKLNVK